MFQQLRWSVVRLLALGALAVGLVPAGSVAQAQACIGCAVKMVANQGFIVCSEGAGNAQNCTTNNGVCTLGGACGPAQPAPIPTTTDN